MKNKFEVRGEVTAIILESPKHGQLETLIDTVDLPKANELSTIWHPLLAPDKKSFYVVGHHRLEDGTRSLVRLHRWIMDTPKDLLVDHINHDTLDNRRSCNLRNVTNSQNQQNLLGPHITNKYSKVLGVKWNKKDKKWQARSRLNGKLIYIGTFETVEEAGNAVTNWRKSNLPFSQEAL